MSVYFALRSQYDSPKLNQLAVFGNDTVLDWFRANWQKLDEKLLGFEVYGFDSLAGSIKSEELGPPSTANELKDILEEHLYVERDFKFSEHAIQAFTDDDELDIAYYIFDDHYLKDNRHKAEFLTLIPWELPPEYSDGKFIPKEDCVEFDPVGDEETGATYCVFACYYDAGGQLEYMNGSGKLDGARLPGLVDYLRSQKQPSNNWPEEFQTLHRLLASTTGGTIPAEFSNFPGLSGSQVLEKLFKSVPSKDPSKCRIQCADHVAQLALNTDQWENTALYTRWILFDDLWAAANSNLANSILRYGNRWDVLS